MDDLKLIKKHYGEDMMHLCRELFPTLLETEGLLFKLLSDNFYYSKLLWYDIKDEKMEDEFKDYVYSLIDVENNNEIITNKTPFELMSDAGYTLYECNTEEDIQRFRKYYAKGEELCTFKGGRLKSCYVFFAIKKNVDDIKRSDKPKREDDYGTSVISIQFRRGINNSVSIKNRYNHRVNNPDCTFHNNLDNIIPGLTKSFEKKYNLKISNETDNYFELCNYAMDMNGKIFKYYYEINNVYYGPNNVIVDNFEQVKNLDPAKILVLDYYIFDFENKTIKCYDENIVDTFPYAFKNINKMEINKYKTSKMAELEIYHDGVVSTIGYDDSNRIRTLHYNGNMKEINNFMDYNEYLCNIELRNVEIIGDNFMKSNSRVLSFVDLPNIKKIKNNFLPLTPYLNSFDAPLVEEIGNNCLDRVLEIGSFIAPKLVKIGENFIPRPIKISKIDLSSMDLNKISDIFSYEIFNAIPTLKASDYESDPISGGKYYD